MFCEATTAGAQGVVTFDTAGNYIMHQVGETQTKDQFKVWFSPLDIEFGTAGRPTAGGRAGADMLGGSSTAEESSQEMMRPGLGLSLDVLGDGAARRILDRLSDAILKSMNGGFDKPIKSGGESLDTPEKWIRTFLGKLAFQKDVVEVKEAPDSTSLNPTNNKSGLVTSHSHMMAESEIKHIMDTYVKKVDGKRNGKPPPEGEAAKATLVADKVQAALTGVRRWAQRQRESALRDMGRATGEKFSSTRNDWQGGGSVQLLQFARVSSAEQKQFEQKESTPSGGPGPGLSADLKDLQRLVDSKSIPAALFGQQQGTGSIKCNPSSDSGSYAIKGSRFPLVLHLTNRDKESTQLANDLIDELLGQGNPQTARVKMQPLTWYSAGGMMKGVGKADGNGSLTDQHRVLYWQPGEDGKPGAFNATSLEAFEKQFPPRDPHAYVAAGEKVTAGAKRPKSGLVAGSLDGRTVGAVGDAVEDLLIGDGGAAIDHAGSALGGAIGSFF